MEQLYNTHTENYAGLYREIIDLTMAPGTYLSENPFCALFGVSHSMIQVALMHYREL
jgi:Transcriptional regulators